MSSMLRPMSISRSRSISRPSLSLSLTATTRLRAAMYPRQTRSVSQLSSRIENELVFPGSVRSKFTNELKLHDPATMSAPLDTYRLIGLDGQQLDSDYEIPFSKDEAVKMYKEMLTISIMDMIMYDAQRQGRLSFYMVSAGEEGSAIGSAAALGKDDQIFLQYREQGVVLHRGVTLTEMMSQLFANVEDHGRGRSMPVHYQSKKLNIHPVTSPLATQIPHAAGAGYALKMKGLDACSIAYFGEGAASEGDFHAALNIAATRNCPTLFLCRNNGYAISTPALEQYRGDGIASRGLGYGIETVRVDGNDIFAVHRVTKEARERAITEQRPLLIEAMSYRVSHHSTSDDSYAYRSKQEVEDWKRRDNPISRMRKWLELKSWWSEDEEQVTRTAIRKQVLKEFSVAEQKKKPALKYLFEDNYDEMTPELKKQKQELKRILETYGKEYDLSAFEGGLKGLD